MPSSDDSPPHIKHHTTYFRMTARGDTVCVHNEEEIMQNR